MISLLEKHIDDNLEILINEFDMKFNDSYVMSKAVECKFFKYMLSQEYFTLAPCLKIISSRVHKNLVDPFKVHHGVLNESFKKHGVNYNLCEIKNF